MEKYKTQVEMLKHLSKLVFIGVNTWQVDRLLRSFRLPRLKEISLEQDGKDFGLDDRTRLDASASNHLGLVTNLKLHHVGRAGLVGLDLSKLSHLTHFDSD